MSPSQSITREFAGEAREFQLPPANPVRLYRGIEAEGLGTLSELSRRAAQGRLGSREVEAVLAHGLSRGHPVTFLRMREIVRETMQSRPLVEFMPLAVDIVAAAYVGDDGE